MRAGTGRRRVGRVVVCHRRGRVRQDPAGGGGLPGGGGAGLDRRAAARPGASEARAAGAGGVAGPAADRGRLRRDQPGSDRPAGRGAGRPGAAAAGAGHAAGAAPRLPRGAAGAVQRAAGGATRRAAAPGPGLPPGGRGQRGRPAGTVPARRRTISAPFLGAAPPGLRPPRLRAAHFARPLYVLAAAYLARASADADVDALSEADLLRTLLAQHEAGHWDRLGPAARPGPGSRPTSGPRSPSRPCSPPTGTTRR